MPSEPIIKSPNLSQWYSVVAWWLFNKKGSCTWFPSWASELSSAHFNKHLPSTLGCYTILISIWMAFSTPCGWGIYRSYTTLSWHHNSQIYPHRYPICCGVKHKICAMRKVLVKSKPSWDKHLAEPCSVLLFVLSIPVQIPHDLLIVFSPNIIF